MDYRDIRKKQKLDAGCIIELQADMIEREGALEKEMLESLHQQEYGPQHFGWPDAEWMTGEGRFVARIGGYDFYRGEPTSSSRWIMVASNDGPDYITTDHPIRHIPGFFDPEHHSNFFD